MRAREFLTEIALAPKELFSRDWRPAAFLDKLRAGTPFVDKAKNQYFPAAGEAERLEPIINKAIEDLKVNPLTPLPEIEVNIQDIGPMNIRKFEKADLGKPGSGGVAPVNVQPIGIGIATEPKKIKKKKGEKAEVIPLSQSIKSAMDNNKQIMAANLYDVIIQNETLDTAGQLGVAIKQAATEINQGQNPIVKQYDEKIQSTIAIDAGEYLGILGTVKGVAEFPKRNKFLKFLGTNDLESLQLIFPGEQNASLADSYGVVNPETGHTIMISSKGGIGKSATGAAPAISGLRTSIENRANEIKPGNTLDFLTLMINTSTVNQGFVGLNWIMEHYPKAIPNYLQEVMPFDESDMQKVIQNIKMKDTTPVPKHLIRFTGSPFLKPSKGPTGGKIVYFLTRELKDIVNEGTIKGFRETILELLDENFMQIFTRVVGGKLVFSVLWPGKIDGKVSLHTKMSSSDMSQALSFKVTD